MKNTDETLVTVYAQLYGWLIAAVRIGERDGAAEVTEACRKTGTIPFHLEHGTRREREAILKQLSSDGLLVVEGNTQARQCGLTWAGVCRAAALTEYPNGIFKTFEIMAEIAAHAEDAGGPDVSPSGSVPEYLLAPELGYWWKDCTQDKREVFTLVRERIWCHTLPALAMRWLTVSADCIARRWFKLTERGHEALKNLPEIPRKLPPESLWNFYEAESDRAWNAACAAKPKDRNAVHIGVSASRWWTPKEDVK